MTLRDLNPPPSLNAADVPAAAPSAFGCHACNDAHVGRRAAERMTGRLLGLLNAAEAREACQRDEIGHLETELQSLKPRWKETA